MVKYLWLSQHKLTAEQVSLLTENGIESVSGGDVDAFNPQKLKDAIESHPECRGVLCVHPAIALNAYIHHKLSVGVFENAMRTGENGQKMFTLKGVHFWLQP